MKAEDVDKMPAGRELDALIAEKIFGSFVVYWRGDPHAQSLSPQNDMHYAPVDSYSTDIGAAWQVVEKMLADDMRLNLVHDGEEWTVGEKYWNGEWQNSSCAEAAPLAICRAALKAYLAAQEPQLELDECMAGGHASGCRCHAGEPAKWQLGWK